MTILPPHVHTKPLPLFSVSFRTLLWREIRRFLTVLVQTVGTPLVSAGLYLTIFVGGLGRQLDELFHGVSYMHYLVPGLAMMGCINQSFNNAASSFMISKFQNNLVDVLVTPLTDLEIACAYGFAAVLRGMLVGILTWGVTIPFGGPWPEEPLLALLILALGGMTFGFLGVGVGVFGQKFDDIARISTFVILPFTYLGAVFIPITSYPDWAQVGAELNPLLYTIDGLRLAVIGRGGVSLVASLCVIAVSVAAAVCFSLYALRTAKAIRN